MAGEELTGRAARRHECDNCGKVWLEGQLKDIVDFWERTEPGSPIPSGDCPECGAFCYPYQEQEPDQFREVQTYYPEGHNDQNYGDPTHRIRIRQGLESQLELRLLTESLDETVAPDLLIERRANGWLILFTTDYETDDPNAAVIVLDNGKLLFQDLAAITTEHIRVLAHHEDVPELDEIPKPASES